MAGALINVPKEARRGEIIELKALVAHVMEPGYRRTQGGQLIPRDLLNLFVCSYNGEEIFRAELYPAMAANPFFAFSTVATESGDLVFTWTGDHDFRVSEAVRITVV